MRMRYNRSLTNDMPSNILYLLSLFGQILVFKCFEKFGLIPGYISTFLLFTIIFLADNSLKVKHSSVEALALIQWIITVIFCIVIFGFSYGLLSIPVYPLTVMLIATLSKKLFLSNNANLSHAGENNTQPKKAEDYPISYKETLRTFTMASNLLKGEQVAKEALVVQLNCIKNSLQQEAWKSGSANTEALRDYLSYFCKSRSENLEKEKELLNKLIQEP